MLNLNYKVLFLLLLSDLLLHNRIGYSRPQLKFDLPIDCKVGKTCWVVNLVDLEKSKKVLDYQCRKQSYDGHKGIDIRIRDLTSMNRGVFVLAPAKGIVKAIRQNEMDRDIRLPLSPNINQKECGNGIILTHGDNWETQYCHLKRASILVKKGSMVTKGQKLGLVGLSGKTEFPHLHFSVRHNGFVIDPFIGESTLRLCRPSKLAMWSSGVLKELDMPLSNIYNFGFSAEVPVKGKVFLGSYRDKILSTKAPSIILWGELNRPKSGQILSLKIFDPVGKIVLRKKIEIRRNQARYFFYAGKKRTRSFLKEGIYRGQIKLIGSNFEGNFREIKRELPILIE